MVRFVGENFQYRYLRVVVIPGMSLLLTMLRVLPVTPGTEGARLPPPPLLDLLGLLVPGILSGGGPEILLQGVVVVFVAYKEERLVGI